MSDPFNSFPNVPNPGSMQKDVSGNKIAAGICGILLGALGIHKFILGYSKEGLIMLLVSILTCGIGAIPMGIIGFIEGISSIRNSILSLVIFFVIGFALLLTTVIKEKSLQQKSI
jgi:TM2 domain-containing membrane protein YozV